MKTSPLLSILDPIMDGWTDNIQQLTDRILRKEKSLRYEDVRTVGE
jgi:hypothetical protein